MKLVTKSWIVQIHGVVPWILSNIMDLPPGYGKIATPGGVMELRDIPSEESFYPSSYKKRLEEMIENNSADEDVDHHHGHELSERNEL